jgi:hypothetical protein
MVLAEAMVLLPVARLSLTACGFRRTHRFCRALFRISPHTDESGAEQRAAMTARMVRVAARHGVCQATCLPRSLVLWILLRRQGLDPSLRIGARKNAGTFEAHAWVELACLKIDVSSGEADSPFVPFALETALNGGEAVTR